MRSKICRIQLDFMMIPMVKTSKIPYGSLIPEKRKKKKSEIKTKLEYKLI